MRIRDALKNWDELLLGLYVLFIIWCVVMTAFSPPDKYPTADYQDQPACGEYFCK